MWQYLPVLFLLACPLMMIFMMRGTGGGMNHGSMNHGSMNHGSDSQPHKDDAPERLAALEAEVAALRSKQARTGDRDGARPS